MLFFYSVNPQIFAQYCCTYDTIASWKKIYLYGLNIFICNVVFLFSERHHKNIGSDKINVAT